MSQPPLDIFLQDITQIQVLHMEGAGAGILGSSSAEGELVQSLKKTALEFVREYRKSTHTSNVLPHLAEHISGTLKTLAVLHVLSNSQAYDLTRQLYELLNDSPTVSS